jgi:hypothetical protein
LAILSSSSPGTVKVELPRLMNITQNPLSIYPAIQRK